MNTKLLRQKILDLAIRGKLTDQRKSDGTARELLEQITASRVLEQNAKSAKSKNLVPIVPLDKSDAPFEIPNSWEWIKLGDVGNWQSGTTPSKSNLDYYRNGTIPWLNTGDLNDGIVSQIPKMVTEKALKETSLRMNDADSVCIAMYGATIGKLGILPIPATTNQACCVCNKQVNFVERMWLFYFLMFHKQEFIEAGFGGAQPNISKEKIVSTAFPLPPLTEQQRIIAKIEEAFAEIDAVEKNKELLKTHIKQTRQKILDLAIHGKLVPQDENDEPACVLLEKILQEKAQTDNKKSPKKKKTDDIATSDNRPYKKNGSVSAEDAPFDIPNSWEWTKLGDVCIINPENKPDSDIEVSFVGMTDIEGGFANRFKSNTRQWDLVKSGFTRFKDGDIAVAKITPCFENRKSVIFTDLKNGYGAGTTELHILRTTVSTCSKYVFWFIKSDFFIQNGIGHFSGAVGQQRVGKDVFQNTYFPLPPLAEQKRIASKVESLFSVLDAMEKGCD